MAKEITFRVEGKGCFPVDMLRYDNAWPATSDDAATIGSLLSGDIPPGHLTQVELRGARCTPGRWQSFGWKVIREPLPGGKGFIRH